MSSRFQASALATEVQIPTELTSVPATSPSASERRKAWVDPAALPDYGDTSDIGGNAPNYVKQLNNNTYMAYGVGSDECFGHRVGKTVKFVKVNIERNDKRQGRLSATTVAEVQVSKYMLNGAGMLHGGCVAYLVDNCCSTPLVVLGIIHDVNGVGVTQAMNVLFHAPAPLGTRLTITSTSIALGGRVMSSRCEILDRDTGRVIASAFLNKMQPTSAKL
ncbi:hypothetical protein AX14_006667 [Amanita brunnescens Koide BX004]|nr:hypothetical protein AX14_006667 [Amanita brunnescens Koide BX004]